MNSHIQLPKLALKHFTNDKGTFCYYDVKKGFVGTKGTPESTNVIKEFHSVDMETYLNADIETPFSKIIIAIKQMKEKNKVLLVDKAFKEAVYKYVQALIARDLTINKGFLDDMVTAVFLTEQQKNDLRVLVGLDSGVREIIEQKYEMTVTVNKTSVPFVLPNSGIYFYIAQKKANINLPVTPELSITLVCKEQFTELVGSDGVVDTFYIDKTEDINYINYLAFTQQCNKNWGVVISPDKKVLDELKELYDSKHKQMLI